MSLSTAETLVSVITPAFNMASTLRRAYESLLGQSFGGWQHVVVDDGSTDGTPGLLRELGKDPRVVWTRTPNQGIGGALNTGLDLASGDFIAFLDADDEYLPNHLSSRLDEMTARPDVDILWGGLEVVADSFDDLLVPDVESGRGLISIHECVAQGTLFVRRRVFQTMGFAQRRNCFHDYDFMQRAVANGFRAKRLFEPTYRYYRNTSTSVVDRIKESWPAGEVS
jgi:glycosyltransferase involved in cell wall biosynthesis